MSAYLPTLLILGSAAAAALSLAIGRTATAAAPARLAAASRALALTTTLQCLHFAEESATGFAARLGPAFGLPAMPMPVFVIFNLLWIAAWIAAVPGIRAGRRWAFFAAWFLGIAGAVNLVAHPLIALGTGGYFPGLATAPLIGIAAGVLLRRLVLATGPAAVSKRSPG